MPIHHRSDGKPVVELDPRLEMSPFVLFRRLRDGNAPRLVDVRLRPRGVTLRAAVRRPDPAWAPDLDREVVLFDDDGTLAVDRTRDLQQRGFERVRALFGGLELYRFSLDPEVVGHQTYLVSLDENAEPIKDDEHHS
jgi:hypothetical protein